MSALVDQTITGLRPERSASVLRWLRSEGDAVKAGEGLVLVEGDQEVTFEVVATVTGVLAEVVAGEGAPVSEGDVVGRIRPG